MNNTYVCIIWIFQKSKKLVKIIFHLLYTHISLPQSRQKWVVNEYFKEEQAAWHLSSQSSELPREADNQTKKEHPEAEDFAQNQLRCLLHFSFGNLR